VKFEFTALLGKTDTLGPEPADFPEVFVRQLAHSLGVMQELVTRVCRAGLPNGIKTLVIGGISS
jgi:hypothetical protein